jgi:hypothetical protein
VLLISADLDELIGLSDSIEVILRGRIVGSADPRTVTPEELGSAMTGAGEAAERAEHGVAGGPAGGRHGAGTVAAADSEEAGRHLAPGPDPVPPDSGPGADPDLDVPLPGTAGPGLTGTGTTGTGDLANDPDAGGEERP